MGCWQPQNISNFRNLWCFDLRIPRWLNWFLECSAFHNSRYQMRRCHWAIRNCSSTGAIDRLWRSFLFLLLCLSNYLMDQIVRHHNGFLEVWCPCGLATFCCLGGARWNWRFRSWSFLDSTPISFWSFLGDCLDFYFDSMVQPSFPAGHKDSLGKVIVTWATNSLSWLLLVSQSCASSSCDSFQPFFRGQPLLALLW